LPVRCRFAIELEHRLRRIRIAFAYRGDIGEAKKFAVGVEVDALQIVDRIERSGHADRVFLETGLDDAGRRDRVCSCKLEMISSRLTPSPAN